MLLSGSFIKYLCVLFAELRSPLTRTKARGYVCHVKTVLLFEKGYTYLFLHVVCDMAYALWHATRSPVSLPYFINFAGNDENFQMRKSNNEFAKVNDHQRIQMRYPGKDMEHRFFHISVRLTF